MKKLAALPWPVRIIAGVVAVLLVPVLVVGASVAAATAATALPKDAAFRVGERVVTEQEFDRRVHTLGALYGVAPPKDAGRLDEFRRASARAITLSMVLEDAARERGIVVPEQAARELLNKQIEQGFQGGRDGFADFLGKVGASEQDVIEAIRLQQSVALLSREVVTASPETVTDEQARQFYEERVRAGKAAAPVPFDQVKEQLRAELARQRGLAKWNAWVEQRVRAADTEYADGYRPAADSAPVPGPPSSGRPQ